MRGGSFSNAANSVLIVNGVLDDFATGSFGPQPLIKYGAGSMILNSNNTYTGTTTISGGTLEVNGSTSSGSAVTVNASGTLAGTGIINGSLSVTSGGTMMAGTTAGIGTLTIGNGLDVRCRQHQCDAHSTRRVPRSTAICCKGMSSVTYGGGTLTVMAAGDALAAGDTFTLFDSSSYGGVFTTYNLPALASGLSWDVYQLAFNGTIQVVSGSTTSPDISTAVTGGGMSLSWHAESHRLDICKFRPTAWPSA